jgi:hypothetical protein
LSDLEKKLNRLISQIQLTADRLSSLEERISSLEDRLFKPLNYGSVILGFGIPIIVSSIDELKSMMSRIEVLSGGLTGITANGEEQTILEYVGSGTISGYIDLKNMDVGDTVVIRQYMKLAPDGEYSKYAEETYRDRQEKPLIYITPKSVDVAIKVTIQQTSGIYRSFDYRFVRRP